MNRNNFFEWRDRKIKKLAQENPDFIIIKIGRKIQTDIYKKKYMAFCVKVIKGERIGITKTDTGLINCLLRENKINKAIALITSDIKIMMEAINMSLENDKLTIV